MPLTPLSNVLRVPEPAEKPLPPPMEVVLWDDDEPQDQSGRVTELRDGAAVVDLSPYLTNRKDKPSKFGDNLADSMDDMELNRIASELLQGIEADNQSRQEWLDTYAEGIKLLGLIVEDTRSDPGSNSVPLEGMSSARHPLLLEACQLFQANARGELLPASGPVKVRDDRPQKPPMPDMPDMPPMMGHNGGPPLDDGQPHPSPFHPPAPPVGAQPQHPPAPPLPPAAAQPPGPVAPQPPTGPGAPSPVALPPHPPQPAGAAAPAMPPGPAQAMPGAPPPAPMPPPEEGRDNLANALEKDFNHYLTVTAQEYYPDTDRMLFSVGFGGQGVKKVYNCPLRRRPISESIPMEDFIVSNALTDLGNATRITHRIRMRPSVLRRMQLMGAYRDCQLGTPTQSQQPNAVDQAKADVAGVQPQVQDPKDADYELYECYCELELDAYAPRQFKGKGLALPYRVTIERDSQKVLEIRRNWREDDEQCLAKEFFVEFPYNKAFGFYGIGLLHILGNTTKTLTAAWRELIDSGMFANFPGFLFAKGAGRQLTNQFRVAPGSGVGLDVGLQRLQDAVMPLPYKDLGPAFTAFIAHVEELGQRVGGTANVSVGEGRQDAPVGTTLALIEQATKPIGAVLKRLHAAQSKEFQLLKERFRDDPEAFWRFNKRPMVPWQKEQFIKALDDFDFVPVSDPNNPTKMHRAAKATALQQIAMGAPGLLNPKKVWARIADALEINDPDELLAPPALPQQGQQQAPVDPAKLASAQAKIHGDQLRSQTDLQTANLEAKSREADNANALQIALINQNTERLRLAQTLAIHADKVDAAERALNMKITSDHALGYADRMHQAEMAQREQIAQENAASQPEGIPQ